jgi:hypothetical protein
MELSQKRHVGVLTTENGMAAKKKTARKKTPRRAAAKLELIAPRGSKRYVRRDAKAVSRRVTM